MLWSEKWQFQLAPEKCLQASNKTTGNSTTPNQYTISSRPISFTDNIRDLGVLIDSKLTFKAHINNIIQKAFIRLRLILKCFRSRDKRILTRTYCTYVRPILEYCSPVWSPQKQAAHNKDRTCPKVFHKGHSRIENSTLQEQTSETRTPDTRTLTPHPRFMHLSQNITWIHSLHHPQINNFVLFIFALTDSNLC